MKLMLWDVWSTVSQSEAICMKNLRPASTWALKKSLKHNMCCSFENSTWFAMFCRIFDINIRPRLTELGTCFPTIPSSCGDTIAGFMNLRNMTVPTAPMLFWSRLGKRLLSTYFYFLYKWLVLLALTIYEYEDEILYGFNWPDIDNGTWTWAVAEICQPNWWWHRTPFPLEQLNPFCFVRYPRLVPSERCPLQNWYEAHPRVAWLEALANFANSWHRKSES